MSGSSILSRVAIGAGAAGLLGVSIAGWYYFNSISNATADMVNSSATCGISNTQAYNMRNVCIILFIVSIALIIYAFVLLFWGKEKTALRKTLESELPVRQAVAQAGF